ncbi:S1 RNA-binding domain-containing protein [Salipiger bermudensis]|nr:S1 RNA-binding domain-containing protein [Salipiger bermudensis]
MMAERDTNDRYLAAFLSDRIGAEFGGRISGIAKFGIFVKLDETGADGLVPMRNIGNEYFHFDREAGTLMGADTGTIITLGQRVRVKLVEAAPVTGGIALDLLELEDAEMPQGRGSGRPGRGRARGPGGRGRPSGPPRRKEAKAKRKDSKVKRKVTRRRNTKS